MHVRVLLVAVPQLHAVPRLHGARLKPEALLWRLGTRRRGRQARPRTCHDADAAADRSRAAMFFDAHSALPAPLDEATDLLLGEVRARLDYLVRVGLGYLTLDRQSRTLSGGEVQRINLTTALGTSLVNTLFVLDEPSIGLHPRDMRRVIEVMHRLRDNGNTLVVVEHDPQIMLDGRPHPRHGPGPGRARRPDRLRGHARRARGARGHADRAVPVGPARRRRRRRARAAPPRAAATPRLVVRGRDRAQPARTSTSRSRSTGWSA